MPFHLTYCTPLHLLTDKGVLTTNSIITLLNNFSSTQLAEREPKHISNERIDSKEHICLPQAEVKAWEETNICAQQEFEKCEKAKVVLVTACGRTDEVTRARLETNVASAAVTPKAVVMTASLLEMVCEVSKKDRAQEAIQTRTTKAKNFVAREAAVKINTKLDSSLLAKEVVKHIGHERSDSKENVCLSLAVAQKEANTRAQKELDRRKKAKVKEVAACVRIKDISHFKRASPIVVFEDDAKVASTSDTKLQKADEDVLHVPKLTLAGTSQIGRKLGSNQNEVEGIFVKVDNKMDSIVSNSVVR